MLFFLTYSIEQNIVNITQVIITKSEQIIFKIFLSIIYIVILPLVYL